MSVTADDLRRIDLFDGLDDAALERLVGQCEERTMHPGEILLETGGSVVVLSCLLEGELESTIPLANGRWERDKTHVAPTYLGVISLLTGDAMRVTIRALSDVRLAIVTRDVFRALLHDNPVVEQHAMSVFQPTMRRLAAREQQQEKLAALGTMAAGLAHELNNPAAAARRTAAELADALEVVQGTIGAFVESGLDRDAAAVLVGLQREAVTGAADGQALDALARSEAEDAVTDRLDAHGVAEAWTVAEPLAAAGLDAAWVDRVADRAGAATEPALRWVAASLTARGLADELREATDRISSLVSAIKEYTYMDQAGEQEVDVHAGVDATLRIMGHKLRNGSVEVRRDYAEDLPKVLARGSELNQVWTNLIDNAIDAVDGDGVLTITTRRLPTSAEVTIHDSGPGIPDSVIARVFEPFFTTKEVGKGTGLGLQTARRIVVDGHGGDLQLTSDDTGTTAMVRLPISISR